eukprot:CAMPEP_0177280850 /NCGR_PEP_ID=MMETSP0367-20130122/70612_1 /TAXON_ID=447022 ORGANISM="Scrippsiella hangoei-like, Strain SHHI-4" /NCGR_SAMPLE_ID=MMETSP0367 /ASSEMBLY_ACC=CAM_ASM_000362 /LENGTH=357 /DNA_ID=CAMNT_0018737663 /DNA_START=36 /DNA_END=1106 /DNA_ORIENTATION=-
MAQLRGFVGLLLFCCSCSLVVRCGAGAAATPLPTASARPHEPAPVLLRSNKQGRQDNYVSRSSSRDSSKDRIQSDVQAAKEVEHARLLHAEAEENIRIREARAEEKIRIREAEAEEQIRVQEARLEARIRSGTGGTSDVADVAKVEAALARAKRQEASVVAEAHDAEDSAHVQVKGLEQKLESSQQALAHASDELKTERRGEAQHEESERLQLHGELKALFGALTLTFAIALFLYSRLRTYKRQVESHVSLIGSLSTEREQSLHRIRQLTEALLQEAEAMEAPTTGTCGTSKPSATAPATSQPPTGVSPLTALPLPPTGAAAGPSPPSPASATPQSERALRGGAAAGVPRRAGSTSA